MNRFEMKRCSTLDLTEKGLCILGFVKQRWYILCLGILLWASAVIPAAAAGGAITILKTVRAEVKTEARMEPSDEAEILTTFEAGADILVVEEIDAEWYSIAYKAQIGYVKKADTADKDTAAEAEAIDEELSVAEYESNLLIEEVERSYAESRQTIIWGVVIGVLVVAIFGVGIYSHFVTKKSESEAEPGQTEAGQAGGEAAGRENS